MNQHNDNSVIDFKGFKDDLHEIHEAAAIFPGMRSIEFEALKEDIKQNGQQVPISLYQNEVVDGRHRLRACRELGIAPLFVSVEDIGGSIGAYVVSMNLHRRHLTDSQRGMIAAKLANLNVGDNQHTAQAVSQGEAAKELSVSVDTLQRAKKVHQSGHTGLIEAVECGDIDVSNALTLTKLDTTELDALTALPAETRAKEMRQKVRDVKKQQKEEHVRMMLVGRHPLPPKPHYDTSIGKFQVLYADPFANVGNNRTAEQLQLHMKDMGDIPVQAVTDDDAALFLVVPVSLLEYGLKIAKTWGFTYRSHAACVTNNDAGGAYFTETHKLLIIATCGGGIGPDVRPSSVIQCGAGERDETPEALYHVMETMFPAQSKLQIFRHSWQSENWCVWENDDAPSQLHTEEAPAVLQLDTEQQAANTEQYEYAA